MASNFNQRVWLRVKLFFLFNFYSFHLNLLLFRIGSLSWLLSLFKQSRLDLFNRFLFGNFWRLKFILRRRFHNDLALFSGNSANLLTYLFDFIIKGLLLFQIANFICVGLALEVVSLLLGQCLPLFADLLHYLQSAHFRMGFHYHWTGFFNENHVC